jgi:AcrR family transcriptional regulator
MAGFRHAAPRAANLPAEPEASAPKAPSTRRGRDTRNKLLAAARDIFSRVGVDDVRVTDITGLAGVASGTFYTYFDSKEQIFREIAAEVLHEMEHAATRDPANIERDPGRDLEYATRQYFLCCRRNARIARSIEERAGRDRGLGVTRHDVVRRGVQRIERWIRRLQEQGVCDAEVETWHTALALHAMNVTAAYDQLVYRDEPVDIDALVKAVARIWRRAVGLETVDAGPRG